MTYLLYLFLSLDPFWQESRQLGLLLDAHLHYHSSAASLEQVLGWAQKRLDRKKERFDHPALEVDSLLLSSLARGLKRNCFSEFRRARSLHRALLDRASRAASAGTS